MPNIVPLRLDIAPLPPGWTGTPQDEFDALEARAEIVTDAAYALFVVGPSAPTSDEGPWFKNGITPYVWDVVTGAYVPVILDPLSLRYGLFLNTAMPASNIDYDVAIKLDPATTPSGSPQSINVWWNGAWTDVYASQFALYPTLVWLAANYFTQAQTTAAIAAATAGGPTIYQFRVIKSDSNQAYTGGAGAAQVTFNGVEYDPESAWVAASHTYVAPVAGYYEFSASICFTLASGSPTAVTHTVYIRHNGATQQWGIENNATALNVVKQIETQVHLGVGDTVDVAVAVDGTGGSTWNIVNSPNQTNFFGKLIKAD